MASKKLPRAERFEARKKLDEGLSGIIINADIVIAKIEYLRDEAVTLHTRLDEDEEVNADDLAELTDKITYFNALLAV